MAFFDTNIDSATLKTLKTRESDPRNLWFYEKVPWIRFQSCGEITGLPGMRDTFLLFNGLNNTIWSRTGPQERSGKNRPAPGVNSLTVTPKNSKGTVREATVNWTCWTFTELNVMSQLYLTPGLTCSVEWGWSKQIREGGAPANLHPKGIDSDPRDSMAFSKAERANITLTAGHAGALQGRIVDFNWTMNEDGGFDCTTVLIGQGDFMNQMTLNKNTEGVVRTIEVGEDNEEGLASCNNMEASIEFAKKMMDNKSKVLRIPPTKTGKVYGCSIDIDADMSDLTAGYGKLGFDVSTSRGIGNAIDFEFVQYVSWAWIEDVLITSNLGFTSTPAPAYTAANFPQAPQVDLWAKTVPKVYSGEITAEPKRDNELIKNYDFLESCDTQVCCLPPFGVEKKKLGIIYGQARTVDINSATLANAALAKSRGYFNENRQKGRIRNILVNLLWLESIYKKHKDSGAIIDFLKELLDGINDACGGIWDFDIITDEAHQCLRVIDTSQMEPGKNQFEFKVFRTDSMVRKINMSTEVSEKLKGSIMAGQAKANAAEEDKDKGSNESTTNAYQIWGKTVKDLSAKKVKSSGAADAAGQDNSKIDKQNSKGKKLSKGELEDNLKLAYSDLCNNREEETVDGAKAAFRGLLDSGKIPNDPTAGGYILPLNMELEIDGLEGLTWGNTITIDYLPPRYKKGIKWKVTKVTQTVSKDDWVTKIETMPLIKAPA